MATPAASRGTSQGRAAPTISPHQPPPSADFPYGRRAKEMLVELKRSGEEFLPPYDDEGVRDVIAECEMLEKMFAELTERGDYSDPKYAFTLSTYHHSILRNKRCIMAYLHYRLNKIESLWWKTASPVIPPEYAKNLSQAELDYYSKFQDITTNTAATLDLDLTSHMQPPRDLYIEVRVLKDAGKVMLQSAGPVMLEKNTIHYLKMSDVEHLIRQEILEEVL